MTNTAPNDVEVENRPLHIISKGLFEKQIAVFQHSIGIQQVPGGAPDPPIPDSPDALVMAGHTAVDKVGKPDR